MRRQALIAVLVCAALIVGGSAANAQKKQEKEEEPKSMCTELVYTASNTSPSQKKNIEFLLAQENYKTANGVLPAAVVRELTDAMCAIQYGSKHPQIVDLLFQAGYEFGHPCRFPCAGRASKDLQDSLEEALKKGELISEPVADKTSDKPASNQEPTLPNTSTTNPV